MPAPLFTSNAADYAKLEGAYITEVNPPGAIEGVDINTTFVTGACVRGPVDTAVEITSDSRFLEVFGGRDATADGSGAAVIGEVWEMLRQKPFGKLVVVRAALAAGVKASFTLESAAGGAGTALLRIDAASKGLWGNDVEWQVLAATNANANYFNLRLRYLGEVKLYENLTIFGTDDNTLGIIGTDDANWVTMTKLAGGRPVTSASGVDGADTDAVTDAWYTNLGQTVASFTSVAGTDSTPVDVDYTATGRALDVLATYQGAGALLVAKRANATINGYLNTLAAANSEKAFLLWNGTIGASKATVISDVASYRSSNRAIYCYNSPYQLDPMTATQVQVPPHQYMASILSGTDANEHIGSQRTKKMTAGITKLTATLTRQDYIDLRAAGICALEKSPTGGFLFVSGVLTDLTSGKTQIARRRCADLLQISAAARLQYYVDEENTEEKRAALVGELVSFSDGLKSDRRIVKDFEVQLLTTDAQRALDQEYVLWRVQLIGHIRSLVLKVQVGTGVVIDTESN